MVEAGAQGLGHNIIWRHDQHAYAKTVRTGLSLNRLRRAAEMVDDERARNDEKGGSAGCLIR